MSVLEEGLVAYIEAQAPTAGKGYPLEVPQDAALPAWAYTMIDDDQLLAHDQPTGFYSARVQIDLMTEESESVSDYASLKTLAGAMRTALDGFKGSWSGVQIKFCKTTLSDDWADIHQLPVTRFDVRINYKLA